MYFEVTRNTPLLRLVSVLMLPMTALAVFSCAHVEPRVNVPVLHNVTVALRPVRVLVGTQTRTQIMRVSARSPAGVWSWREEGPKLLDTVSLDKAPVNFLRGTVLIGEKNWGEPAVIIVPAAGESVRVNEREYPGQIALVARADSVIAINFVPMEQYIAGVVSREMPAVFEASAQQAQAVAARSYTLWQMKQNRLALYDVKDDTSSQVYEGLTGTNSAGRQAAKRTEGTVLVYDWQFLPAFYFSTCGGHTAPAPQLRGAPVIEPLSGVTCEYCRASRLYTWQISIPAAEIETALAQAGYIQGSLTDISVSRAIPGGWVDTVEITSTGGHRQVAGYVLRQVVGVKRLFSLNFTVQKLDDVYVFKGRGYGHGVGLCQWGANGQAALGRNYVDIVTYYYPGAGVLKIY